MGRLEPRKRNRVTKSRKPVIAIGCEGKNKTETTYFKNFFSREYMIRFSTGRHTDPIGMVNDLVDFIKTEDIKKEYNDKIYLLLDTDINENKQEQIDKVKKICKKNGIELITSTPTFEYWYILHFENTTKKFTSSKQVKADLKTKILNYTESMNIYPLIKNNMGKAIKRAKSIEKSYIKNGQEIDNENANPHTSVYKVVEELNSRK